MSLRSSHRRRAEPDVATHPARAEQGRVEPVHRHVGRADEVDLVAARARRRQPQRHLAEPARDDVRRVEHGVELARQHPAHERRIVDPVHDHEQLVECERAAAHPGPAREHEVLDAQQPRVEPARRDGARLALVEDPVAPCLRLEDEVAGRVQRAPGSVEHRRLRVHDLGARAHARVQRLPAHADGVDLVDEDDARAAPLARQPLGLAREVADEDRVDADERRREAGAGDRDERRVEAGRDRLRQHRLAGARRAEEEQAALALAARALERLAGLPEADDAANLLLRLGLAADVVELDAPLRVARLEAPDLADAHQEHRPHQDREVRDEEEEDEDHLRPERRASRAPRRAR